MGRPLKLLVVEDYEMDGELVVLELSRHGYDVAFERVDTRAALGEALTSRQWDFVVCDHGLPSFSSLEALSMVRDADAELPFVVLSGTIGEEAAVESLKAGARDVVLKSNLARIGPVVDRELREAERRRSHRRAEEALLESEARKSAILDSALDAVISIDHDGRIVDFNPAAEAMFGYARERVSGRPVELIIPPSVGGGHEQGLARQLAAGPGAGAGARVEVVGRRADRSEFPLELSISRGDLAGLPFFTGYLRDLTQHKQAECERANLESQLRQAQKMEAIGRLAGGITHDFNNLLAIVTGYSELLLRQLEDDDPRRLEVREIKKAGEKATALTRQLLAFSRQQTLEMKVLDVNAVVVGMEPMLRRVIREDIELVTRLDPAIRHVKADPSQLEQVIMNLAVNARDAMPEGGTLEVGTREMEIGRDELDRRGSAFVDPGPYAVLWVRDTGTGIDAETRSRIFEPFFTTKGPGKGTGLGLATVYGIVKQSDGVIRVDSAPERGTTFSVCLPVVEAPVDVQEPQVSAAGLVDGSETVLVVEDDAPLLHLVGTALRADGYTVLEAQDGSEAIALCSREHTTIDLLITDVVMPGMGGEDLAREILAVRPGARLLFMSGYSEHGIGEPHRRELRAGFIQKPFTLTGLSRKVRELLDS